MLRFLEIVSIVWLRFALAILILVISHKISTQGWPQLATVGQAIGVMNSGNGIPPNAAFKEFQTKSSPG